jgi:hypothetical protein
MPDTSITSRFLPCMQSAGETARRVNAVGAREFRTLSHKALDGQRLRFLAIRQRGSTRFAGSDNSEASDRAFR